MFSKLLYYLIIYPSSFLPMRVLYLFTDVLYLILRFVFPYRRNVIRGNLERSFPSKTTRELRIIERDYLRHFTDLLAEGVKNLSVSESELNKRFQVINPEIMDDLYKANKSVVLVSGHYNNWEWLITSQQLLFRHKAVGIGTPLSNKFWDKKINARRARFGMDIVNSKNVREYFAKTSCPIATLTLSDQSPGESSKSYWMDFLNQTTAVLFGTEMLANKFDHAVVFFHTKKVKRGHYKMHLQLITKTPRKMAWGEITERHTKLLEEIIQEAPEYWLWSHKRWKREIPKDLAQLRVVQRKKFEEIRRTFS